MQFLINLKVVKNLEGNVSSCKHSLFIVNNNEKLREIISFAIRIRSRIQNTSLKSVLIVKRFQLPTEFLNFRKDARVKSSLPINLFAFVTIKLLNITFSM